MRLRALASAAVTIAFGTLATPLAAGAQQPAKVPRIGYLSLHAPSELDEAFRRGLREKSWIEGQNIAIEYRTAEWRADRLPGLAAELVRLKVDLLFVTSTAAAQAAKSATRSIPIVFANILDPIRAGLVTSLARPEGNMTGLTTINVELSAKRLELLKEVVPKARRVAVFINPDHPQAPFLLKETQTAAGVLGLELRVAEVRRAEELEKGFAEITKPRAGGLLVLPDPLHNIQQNQTRIADIAMRNRLPMMGPYRGNAEAGGLMSYGTNLPELFRRGATYVDKILKGAKPVDLPVEQAMRFELVINMNTAKALGLMFPQSILLRADHIIQ
jgi:putative ABC transport system substrate-binding protein